MVEDYLDVYLRTPDLPKDDIARALVARGRARKGAGEKLLLMASRGQCSLLSHGPPQGYIPLTAFQTCHSVAASHVTPRRLSGSLDVRPF